MASHGKTNRWNFLALGRDSDTESIQIRHYEETYTYRRVMQMMVLGVLLDGRGSTDVSMDHRLAIADNCARGCMHVLRGPGGVADKMRAWSISPAATAIFGCSTWHITQGYLRRIRRWENQWLRKVFRCRRKNDEGYMQYNIRTARLIEHWLAVSGTPPLFLRIIRILYRAAWRENCIRVGNGDTPLAWLREARSALWWSTCCAMGRSARYKHGIMQQASGHSVMWEDMFVEFLGLEWRQARSACRSYSDWRAGETSFAEKVCEKWGLPWKRDQPTSTAAALLCVEIPKAINSGLTWNDHPDDEKWQSTSQRIQFIVDSQIVAMLMSGSAVLSDACYRPVFVRMGRNLAALVNMGWHPCAFHRDFVQWRPRAHNSIADLLCNEAMDSGCNINDLDAEGIWRTANNGNFRINSDGGRRNSSAALGWVVRGFTPGQQGKVLARIAMILPVSSSSFCAEVLALDNALEIIRTIFCSHSPEAGKMSAEAILQNRI